MRDASGSCPAELLERVLFDAIAAAGHSLRLTCLMGERPGPAEAALSLRGCSCMSTPLSGWCDRWYGFSDDEVQTLPGHAGREEYLDDAREWPEGYRFGRTYCSSPARVIDFLTAVARRRCGPICMGYADSLSRAVGDWNLERLFRLCSIYLNRMDALRLRFVWAPSSRMTLASMMFGLRYTCPASSRRIWLRSRETALAPVLCVCPMVNFVRRCVS